MRIRDLVRDNWLHETASIVALIRARLVTPYQLSSILDHTGSAVDLVQLSEEDRLFKPESPTHTFVGAVTDEDIASAIIDVEGWVARRYDIRTVLDDSYPDSLRTIFNRPPLLTFEGAWDSNQHAHAVAVVGTRQASEVGLRRAAKLSRELVEAGVVIYSGLAAGIDSAAHRAALDAGGRTIAVMGTGIELRYPRQNTALSQEIVDSGGALVSQFFPRQPPQRWTFPQRNVVMSGLTLATVVVEAGATSGARMQARVALQHGRTVFLLRSLVDQHDWARQYIEEGVYQTRAIEISSTDDILDRLSPGTPDQTAIAI